MNSVKVPTISQEILRGLSVESKAPIERLADFLANTHLPDLSDTLSQESASSSSCTLALRTHAGQTALPGGRVDEGDKTFVETALREAYEEVQLPLGSLDIHVLGVHEPFLSLHKLLVTPVFALLTRNDLLGELKPSEEEVSKIFSHPLEAVLDPQLSEHEANLATLGSEDWPYATTYYNTSDSQVVMLGNTTYRMHRFRTSASPIKGLTSDILIKAAQIAYGRETVYERFAPGQIWGFEAIMMASQN